jgi:hypothetical protein
MSPEEEEEMKSLNQRWRLKGGQEDH